MQPSNELYIPTLSAGWCDKDHVILHACFQLLTDFVEKELTVSPWVNWQQDEEHAQAREEIELLYVWWKDWLKKLETPRFQHGQADYEKENEMMKRLIEVRKYLWT